MNEESNFSKTVDAEIQNSTDINTKELNYDLSGTYIVKFFVKKVINVIK